MISVQHRFCKFHCAPNPLGNHDTKLPQQAAHHVAEQGPLPHDQIACTMEKQHALLLFGLDRHEAHRGSRDSLADCFCVDGVRLATLMVLGERARLQCGVQGSYSQHVNSSLCTQIT